MTAETNGPACAYCGRRYDFAGRPVRIENTCPDCLPTPQPKHTLRTVVLTITPRLRRKPAPVNDFQQAMDRVTEVLATPPEAIDRLRSEFRALSADPPRDLLQRHLLCAATRLHDPAPDGTCRDCGTLVGDLPVCAPDVLIKAEPDGAP